MLQLEEAAYAVSVHIVGDGGPAEADGALKHILQGEAQTFEFGPGEASGAAAGSDAGTEEALIRINVAHAGEQGLVEQGCFDGQFSTPEEGCEFIRADGKRLFAGSAKACRAFEIYKFEAAKAARVNETDLASAGKPEARMGVVCHRAGGGRDEKAAGHAEVDDPLSGGIRVFVFRRAAEFADDVFAGAMDIQDDAPFETLGLQVGGSFEGLGVAAEPSLDDLVAAYTRVDTAGDCLDFRQLGHRIIVEDR